MNYLLCPKQYQAERRIEKSFADKVCVILNGDSQTGKTTVAKRLLKNSDRTLIYTAYVPGSFTKVYGSVELAFSAALGLPIVSEFMRFHTILRALGDLIGGREFRLIFDDAGVHFGGSAEQRDASNDFLRTLISRLPSVKLLFVSRLGILDDALSDVVFNKPRCVDISSWQYDQAFRDFIAQIGGACGFKPSQLTDDYFIKGLLDKSHGASGAIIKIFQILARHSHYKARSYLPAECLHNLWRF